MNDRSGAPGGTRSIGSLLEAARGALRAAPFKPSLREAVLLLAHTLALSEAQVLARIEEEVSESRGAAFQRLLERRLAGEPIAYLFGEKEFYGRPFHVDRRVLIPRPETEHLVEAALDLVQDLPPKPRILDVGTGSGCLALTLALEIPAARVLATDVSPAALAVAAGNVRRHDAGSQVKLACADLLRGLRVRDFDLVVSNPPYVEPDEAGELSVEVREYEPHVALFASGGSVAARLLEQAAVLSTGVHLLLEIGYGQASRMEELARVSCFDLVELRQDYARIPRLAILRRK